MAYATSSGTIDAMVTALAAFALANGGFSAPTEPAAQNYWRVHTCGRGGGNVYIAELDFKTAGGSSVGAPDTTLFSSQATSFEAAGVWDGSNVWRSSVSGSGPSWIGGQWNSAVSVRQVTITYDLPNTTNLPINLALEYSADGSTWTTLTCFSIDGLYSAGTYTYEFDGTTWPLQCGDDLLYMISKQEVIQDSETDDVAGYADDYTANNVYQRIYPTRWYLSMGKTAMGAERSGAGKTIYDYTPENQQVAEWHFFADTTVSNHVHCVFRTTHKGTPRWNHWSMGEIDKLGMTHGGVGYMYADGMRFYIQDDGPPYPHRSTRDGNPFLHGALGYTYENTYGQSLWYFLDDGADYPVANDGAWPARGVTHNSSVSWTAIPAACLTLSQSHTGSGQLDLQSGVTPGFDAIGMCGSVHPVSGYASLGTIPVAVTAGPFFDDLVCFLGEIPGVRSVRIDNLSDGGEIDQDTVVWKTFPRLRKTDLEELDVFFAVSSGFAGWAYRKVT